MKEAQVPGWSSACVHCNGCSWYRNHNSCRPSEHFITRPELQLPFTKICIYIADFVSLQVVCFPFFMCISTCQLLLSRFKYHLSVMGTSVGCIMSNKLKCIHNSTFVEVIGSSCSVRGIICCHTIPVRSSGILIGNREGALYSTIYISGSVFHNYLHQFTSQWLCKQTWKSFNSAHR